MQRFILIGLISIFTIFYFINAKSVQTPTVDIVEAKEKIKILIVVGHDNDVTGSRNMGVGEVELNRILANHLFYLLKNDPIFEPSINQQNNDYIPELKEYFEENKEKILSYIKERKEISKKENNGLNTDLDVVTHNKVTGEVANRLYGTSMWAEEKGFDFILHVHFNDYPGRPRNQPGKYSGFAIYIPDESLKNHKDSVRLAKVLYDELAIFQPKSNLPVEKDGIIESKHLIAIGTRNTLSIPSILVEYGYIAEPRLQGEGRDIVIKEMAEQTYTALKNFFNSSFATPLSLHGSFSPFARMI
jgi:hypothetical protein